MNRKLLLIKIFFFLTLTVFTQQAYAQNDSLRTVQVTRIAIVDADKVQNEVMDMDEYEEGNSKKDGEEVFIAIDQPAEFPGGVNALMEWLRDHIKYPQNAYRNNIEGRAVVKFIVEKDGSIGEAEVVTDINPELEEEALRVVKSMPKWEPGKNNGVPVRSFFNLPITFKIPEDERWKEDNTARGVVNQEDSIPQNEIFDMGEVYDYDEAERFDKYGDEEISKGNIKNAIAYYKEAFDINPFVLNPIEKAEEILLKEANNEELVGLYDYSVQKLIREEKLHENDIPRGIRESDYMQPAIKFLEKLVELQPDNLNYTKLLLYYYVFIPEPSKLVSYAEQIFPRLEKNELSDYDLSYILGTYTTGLLMENEYQKIQDVVTPYKERLLWCPDSEISGMALWVYVKALNFLNQEIDTKEIKAWLKDKAPQTTNFYDSMFGPLE